MLLIKTVYNSNILSDQEKKLILNIINNPEFDIQQYFPELLSHYKRKLLENNLKNISDRQIILDKLFLKACYKLDLGLAKVALYLGANINAQDQHSLTALMRLPMVAINDQRLGLFELELTLIFETRTAGLL